MRHFGFYGNDEDSANIISEQQKAASLAQTEYEERFSAQEQAFQLDKDNLLSQAQAAELERAMIAEKLGVEVGIRTYTDEERAALGITGADIDELYDTERQQVLQDINNRLKTVQDELTPPQEEEPGLPWGWITVIGVASLIGLKFAIKKG